MAEISEWFPELPPGWRATKAKNLFIRERRNVRPEDDVVTAFRDGQVALRRKRRAEGFTFSTQESGYQGIRKGDLVVHAMDAFAGAIGIAEDDGKSTPVYSACTAKTANVYLPFYARLLRHMALRGFVEALSKGIRERTTEFRWADLAEVVLPEPPYLVQVQLANYLDAKTAAIDALIAKKELLIEGLKKYQEAVIAEAVKPREGWRKMRLKQCVRERISTGVGEAGTQYEEGHARYLRTSDIGSLFTLKSEDPRTLPPEVSAQAPVRKGDILVTTAGSVGKTYLHSADGEFCYAGFLAKVSLQGQYNPRFFAYVLASRLIQEEIAQAKVSSTIDNFSASKLGELAVSVPALQGQDEVVAHLDKKLATLSAVQENSAKALKELKSLRLALISEAVTGKLRLPD